MDLKRTSHAVYDTKYHLVWTPKYRKWVLRGDIREKAKRIFEGISGNHVFEILLDAPPCRRARLTMVNRYTQAVGNYDAVEAHKRYSPIDNLKLK